MPPRAIACSGLRGLVAMAVDPGFVPLGWRAIRVSSALVGVCGAVVFAASVGGGSGLVRFGGNRAECVAGARGRWLSFGLTARSGYGHGCNRGQCCPDGRQ